MKTLGTLGRLWPYAAAMLAMLYACSAWTLLKIIPSGMLLLALVVGTFAIATWLTTPITLAVELSQTPRESFWLWAPIVIIVAMAISIVHMGGSFSMLSTGFAPSFVREPPELASGFLMGFLAAVTAYPYLKLEMEPEKATLVGVVVGFATYATWGIIWIALAMTVLARWLCVVWLFYGWRRLARASCPRIAGRLV